MNKLNQFFCGVFLLVVLGSCSGTPQKEVKADAKKSPIDLFNEIDKSASPNTLTASEREKGWNLLFDGTSSTGWHGFNQKGMPECWAVEDGTLTMKSVGGGEEQDLLTNKSYKSFAIFLEYKLTKGANSGLLYHIAEGEKYKFAYETGPEFQIIDHESWPDPLEEIQINGSNYMMYAPKVKPYKPLGEWNQVLLVVDGNNVTQILNGEVVVEFTKYSDEWNKLRNSGKWVSFPDYGKYDEGHISIQNHGTKVWYRNIKLNEIK